MKWNWLALNATRGSTILIQEADYYGDVIYWLFQERTVPIPHGYGIMFRSSTGELKYKGHWKNGAANGWGTYFPRNRQIPPVSGAWRNGRNPRCKSVVILYKPSGKFYL